MQKTHLPTPRRLIAMLTIVVATFALTGCLQPSAEKTETVDAQALVDSLTYVKAKNGLCFGVATTSRMSTNISYSESNLLVVVECNKAGL